MDIVADMLTQIRNANRISRRTLNIPSSKLRVGIAEVLKREGFIEDFKLQEDDKQGILRIYLKYGPDGEKVIRRIERISRSGRRIYRKSDELKPVIRGLGITVLSTSRGILSDRECREKRVGGEVLARVW